MTLTTDLPKSFDPSTFEQVLYQEWETNGFFSPSQSGPPYSIAIPPPNITGTLHLGHAFQQTLMDTLIRYRRMSGCDTLWQTGTDHAGISTQMVVSEQLRREGFDLKDLGREAFLQRVWKWREESGGRITQQMRRMGVSVDWARERFTMDSGFSKAVQTVFVRLYEEGLIYRGKRLVNWDPHFKTALSDLEVLSEQENGYLWHLKYPLADGDKTLDGKDCLVVATTRPETMLGDTAVAVHPDDPRYRNLVGKFVNLPIANRKIPVIEDRHVDPEFGTGCLKITPAHDFDDYAIGERHGLPLHTVIDFSGKMNENTPQEFRGVDRFEARAQVVERLKDLNLLNDVEEYEVQIPRGERSGVIVEPLLTDQWFVDIQALAKPAIDAVKEGKITFVPKRWENVFFNWMNELRDWCISRQLWWGHRIPAWYDSAGNIYVGSDEPSVRKKYSLDQNLTLSQDPDVLETWFSSSLWTFGTLGWPKQTDELQRYHPTDVLVTGHDIIFFWVARMIMMTIHFTQDVPFHTVYITGLIRDAEGQKMSKTKGNGLDPLDLVDGISLNKLLEKRTQNLPQASLTDRIAKNTKRDYPNGIKAYGTDALRFTFCAIASPSSSYNFDTSKVEGYHFFCNKLWNATRFVLSQTESYDSESPRILSNADKWIQSRLSGVIVECRTHLDEYRFDLFAQTLYDFVWHEFCDWYIELAKPALYRDIAPKSVSGVQMTLLCCCDAILRIAHPVMPFITESLWKPISIRLGKSEQSLMLCDYPSAELFDKDKRAEQSIEWLKRVVNVIRTIRGERRIPPQTEVRVLFRNGTRADQDLSSENHVLLCKLATVSEIKWLSATDPAEFGSVQMVNGLELTLPFIDDQEMKDELERLEKEQAKVVRDLEIVTKKLGNIKFVERAPDSVVASQREKERSLSVQLASLSRQVEKVNEALLQI